MKKITFLVLIVVLAFSCKKEDENVLFTMNYDVEITILPGLNPFSGNVFGMKVRDVSTNFNSYLMANGIQESDIKRIDASSATLTSLFSSEGYGFIQNAEVYISKTPDSTYNKLVFERFQVPENNGVRLDMIGSLVDAKPILMEDKMEVWFEMFLRDFSPTTMDSRLELEFKVIGH